ncbi:MAG: CoB--CoM heterodisulfide reductase iron-sulfur subunit B family protein [Proteobacteria bacterium]|nr:CoB--CoM heterodisulfide reductase iron-sulfur subunit B family protein [Pseudomonadota bacterium]
MRICFYPGCSYASTAGYKESTEAVCQKLGIELVVIPDWNCCGATVMFGENKLRATALAARHFALTQAMGFEEIVTGCNACYATLGKAARLLNEDAELFIKTKDVLQALGLTLDRIPKIRHLFEILTKAMPDAPSERYRSLSVGAYYGCQLTRPHQFLDKGGYPEILETFLERIGFAVTDHSARTQCCGASHAVIYKDECRNLSARIIREISDKGAQIITTICPLCQFNLDQAQTGDLTPRIPVTYFTQLAGLALGLSATSLGMNKLLVSAEKVISRP